MTKNYWLVIIVAAGIAILLFFLLQGDRHHDTHADQHADVVADHDTLNAHGADYVRVNDSLTKEIIHLKDENKSLITGQATTQRKLDAKASEVKTLVAQIREYNQDTGYFGHLLDSMEEQVQSLTFLVTQYEQYADSINNVNDNLKIGHDAVIKEKDKRIAELQSAYDKLFKAYQTLFAESTSLQKDLRRQKLKTKIAGVLGIAAGVLALLK